MIYTFKITNKIIIFLFILILSLLSATNNLFSEDTYYLNVLKFGTDSDIIDAFSRIQRNLGSEVNNQILKIFKEKHRLEVYNALINYIRVNKLEKAKNILVNELNRKKASNDYIENVIYTIGELKVKSALNRLIDLLKDEQSPKRIKVAAIDALGMLGASETEDLLLKLVKNKKLDIDIRGHAILTLGKIKSKKADPILRKILENKYEKELLRMYSAFSIKEIEGDASIKFLSKFIDDKNPKVAEYVTNSIAQLKSQNAGDILIEALRSDYDGVRYYAAVGLGEIGYKKAVDILEFKHKYDSNKKVRDAAKKALDKIKGQSSSKVAEDGSVEKNEKNNRKENSEKEKNKRPIKKVN